MSDVAEKLRERVARALSIPQHHAGWDHLPDADKDLFYMQADYALHEMRAVTDEQVKHMVNRFLMWRLPENFHPDAGISFKPTFNDHLPTPMKHNPTGTNLFDADQAEQMVRFMLEGLPARAEAGNV